MIAMPRALEQDILPALPALALFWLNGISTQMHYV